MWPAGDHWTHWHRHRPEHGDFHFRRLRHTRHPHRLPKIAGSAPVLEAEPHGGVQRRTVAQKLLEWQTDLTPNRLMHGHVVVHEVGEMGRVVQADLDLRFATGGVDVDCLRRKVRDSPIRNFLVVECHHGIDSTLFRHGRDLIESRKLIEISRSLGIFLRVESRSCKRSRLKGRALRQEQRFQNQDHSRQTVAILCSGKRSLVPHHWPLQLTEDAAPTKQIIKKL